MNLSLLQFCLSLMAVGGLVALTHIAGFSKPAILQSEAEARALARLAPGGCEAAKVALDRAGKGALVVGEDGRMILLRPLGARFVPVMVAPGGISADGARLLIRAGGDGVFALDIGPDTALWSGLHAA